MADRSRSEPGPELRLLVLVPRVRPSLVHISHPQTDAFVAVRFPFFSLQIVCFIALIGMAVANGIQDHAGRGPKRRSGEGFAQRAWA